MKIAIVSSNNNFLRNIPDEMKKRGHEVSMFMPTGLTNLQRISRFLAWADVVYYEWADQSLEVGITIRPDKPTVVRMHRYEVYSPIVNKINWEDVDLLMFNCPSDHIWNKFKGKAETLPKNHAIIPDGIDLNKFKFNHERELEWNPPWQLYMGSKYITRKGMYFAIQALADLKRRDWVLNIVAPLGGEYYENCMEIAEELELLPNIKTINHIPNNADFVKFLHKMHVVISYSTDEGNHNVVREAMATGCYPFVNSWLGSKKTYPNYSLFASPHHFISLLNNWMETTAEQKQEYAHKSRSFVEKRYDMNVQTPKIVDAIEKVMEES